MSRIGNKTIIIEKGVNIAIVDSVVNVEGTNGKLSLSIPPDLKVEFSNNEIKIKNKLENGRSNIQGLFRTLLQNAVTGVTKHWLKSLELVGVGYRAQVNGRDLVLNVGFTHQVFIKAPEGISFKVEENKITVSGADKYLVGEIAASVRRVKEPEPYKGKGIRYQGEYIRKKLGKAAKAVGGATGAK